MSKNKILTKFTSKYNSLKRRKFVNNVLISSLGLGSMSSIIPYNNPIVFPYKLSLAQFSLARYTSQEGYDLYSFAETAHKLGFQGLEYMSVLYKGGFFQPNGSFGLAEAKKVAKESLKRSNDYGLKNLLIMVDGEGNLANKDRKYNDNSVENHKKWIDCASEMGCHSIRVNLDSDGSLDDWTNNSVESLNKLCEYAKSFGLNIIIENHTTYSGSGGESYAANADYIINVINKVDYDNIGTLPDFGNWCQSFKKRDRSELISRFTDNNEKDVEPKVKTTSSYFSTCNKMYDIYEGVSKLLPYAKAVSAKVNSFDENGEDLDIDYTKMLKIIKDSNYSGYIGVEQQASFEDYTDPIQAINLTKELLFKSWSKLS